MSHIYMLTLLHSSPDLANDRIESSPDDLAFRHTLLDCVIAKPFFDLSIEDCEFIFEGILAQASFAVVQSAKSIVPLDASEVNIRLSKQEQASKEAKFLARN